MDKPNKYTLETLQKENPPFQGKPEIQEQDINQINTLVHLIQKTRSKVTPKEGDKVRFTIKEGNYYDNAHINHIDNDQLSIYEVPHTPFVSLVTNGITTHAGGGTKQFIPISGLKYIGKEEKDFLTLRSGVHSGEFIYFKAEVSLWQYAQPDPLYPGFNTKDWRKIYLNEHTDPEESFRFTTWSGPHWKTQSDFDHFVKKFKGTTFPGNSKNQIVLWCYHDKYIRMPNKQEWDNLPYPLSTEYINGPNLQKVKLRYDDDLHTLYQYYFEEKIYEKK